MNILMVVLDVLSVATNSVSTCLNLQFLNLSIFEKLQNISQFVILEDVYAFSLIYRCILTLAS